MGKAPVHDNREARVVKRRAAFTRVIFVGSSSIGRRVLHGLEVAVILAFLLVGTHAKAAPFDLSGSDWEGCAELVRLARKRAVAVDRIISR